MNYRPVPNAFLFYLKYTNDVHTSLQEYGIACIDL